MRRSFTTIVATAFVLAACSSDDDGAGQTTALDPVETVASSPPTTDPPPTTEEPATTPPTTPPTTAPSITTSSTTTTPPTSAPASPTDAAVAAFRNLKEVTRACFADLPACDTSKYAEVFGGEQLAKAVAEVEDLKQEGYLTSNVESLTEDIEDAALVAGEDGRVDITFCAEDGVILSLPSGTGTTIVNDRFVSNRLVAQMHLDDDNMWRLHAYLQLGLTTVGVENSQCR